MQTRRCGGEHGQISHTHQGKGHKKCMPMEDRKAVELQTADYRRQSKPTDKWLELGVRLWQIPPHDESKKLRENSALSSNLTKR